MDNVLKNRLTYGSIMLLALMGLLWLDHMVEVWTVSELFPRGIGGIGLLIISFILLPPATGELARLFTAVQVKPYRIISAIGSNILALHAFTTQFKEFHPYSTSTLVFIVISVMLLSAFRRALRKQPYHAIHDMAGTVLATLYLGGLMWFLMALRVKNLHVPLESIQFVGGTFVVLMILLTVKAADIGAFFGGRAFGRHKMIPWLSPGKTWEGLFFGLLMAGLAGALCAVWMDFFSWMRGLIFGIVIGGVGQLGDLLESMMKRDAEMKDSGSSIPGFGGVLDVMDSPLLAAPFAYLLFSLFRY